VEAEQPRIVGEWDAGRIARMLAHLISNAVKYSPEGGEIVLRVCCTEDDFGAWAVLEVTDHGLGIPAESLPRIFERVQRGEHVGQIYGTGLGRASARQIVELHEGHVSVQSETGAGSTFTVRLPLRPPVTIHGLETVEVQ
jgi:signal transduction histidine kinase